MSAIQNKMQCAEQRGCILQLFFENLAPSLPSLQQTKGWIRKIWMDRVGVSTSSQQSKRHGQVDVNLWEGGSECKASRSGPIELKIVLLYLKVEPPSAAEPTPMKGEQNYTFISFIT